MSQALNSLFGSGPSAASAAVLGTLQQSLSAADTIDAVSKAAEMLANACVRRLALAADNSPDWIITDLAARLAGIPVVPLPPFFSATQSAHVLADSGADAIAADELGSRALKSLPTRFAGELTPSLSLLRLSHSAGHSVLPSGTAKISYTSGTTGSPKGVCLTQGAIDRVAVSLSTATADLDLKRHLCLLPLATLLENIAGVDAPLLSGAEIRVPSLTEAGIQGSAGVDISRLIDCLHAHQPASVILLPQLLAGLVGAVEQGASLPESLRFAAVGGAVVGCPLLERADRAGIPVFEGYGLTECSSVVALNTPKARRSGSVGRPLPHCRVRFAADHEVLIDGAGMAGYLGNDPLQEDTVATGDIGHLDADGYLYIDGRKKNILITSFGRNFSPEWVEASLNATRSIAQSALFGDGRPFNVAVIVPTTGATVMAIERDLAEINSTLPDYARVRSWVMASEPFKLADDTLTANGRVRRPQIYKRYAPDIEACYALARESCA